MSLLFKRQFHDGIRAGTIDLTFRHWKSARVVSGRTYRCGEAGMLAIDSVAQIRAADVLPEEVLRSGFDDRVAMFRALKLAPDSADAVLYRVAFRYQGPVLPHAHPSADELSARQVDDVVVRLNRMDSLSKRGPWTAGILRVIAEHERAPSAQIAPFVGREQLKFKADVRKLKKLGLTISYEAGYGLTALGLAALARLGDERPR